MLVNIYLDQILTKSNNETEQTTRSVDDILIIIFFLFHFYLLLNFSSKLQAFIITSNSFRVQSVLNRINQTNRLQREVALLYGKVIITEELIFLTFTINI